MLHAPVAPNGTPGSWLITTGWPLDTYSTWQAHCRSSSSMKGTLTPVCSLFPIWLGHALPSSMCSHHEIWIITTFTQEPGPGEMANGFIMEIIIINEFTISYLYNPFLSPIYVICSFCLFQPHWDEHPLFISQQLLTNSYCQYMY